MMNTQILPNAFYGIQNFIDSLNAANAQGGADALTRRRLTTTKPKAALLSKSNFRVSRKKTWTSRSKRIS